MGILSEAHICQCFSRLATQKRNSLVTINGARQKTGQQLVDSVLSLARGLLQLGLQNGDVVAISAFNSDWYLEWILAVAFIGGIVAPLNYRWVYLHTAPLCHIGGLSSAMAMLMVGACHAFIPKFEATLALEAIEQHHVTSLITVPAMMADLISSVRLKRIQKGCDSVKKILNGGGGLSDNLIKDATRLFPRAKLLSAYGMTETCSSLTFTTLFEPMLEASGTSLQMLAVTNSSPVKARGVCVGKPAPHVEIKICVDGSSNVGRILTRGPHVMLRYWDQIPEKASNSVEETWLDTGDIGFIDDHGNLWLVGRTNGHIKSGGENIYPEEVEAVLIQHPGVLSSVVVGIPDPRLTELVVACIRLRENWQWSDDSFKYSVQSNELFLSSTILRLHCREKNLTGFKIPKIFILWKTQFPLTTTGKIRRDQIRKEVMSQQLSFPNKL
ncbi:hypothetical protein ES288_A05G117800v1 [Gossypium darwinii]|uniref:AMP-dependent synthetase/ligase domain-containing protein n=1 Tax=Gossypium darwinii TaxID=34276 RepID=A0A5D2GGS6_GOSDA|nr:hypothetical protein ES288_A05G117800v1 [Gossypium darwinii]